MNKKDNAQTYFYDSIMTPIGELILVSDGESLCKLGLPKGKSHVIPEPDWIESDEHLIEIKRQLEAYFKGELNQFDLKLNPKVTEFQEKVLNELCNIPYGETRSYKCIAESINNPKAVRAVGLANGKNPIPIIIPCHRVIGSNGSLTGFGGGLEAKKYLLELEGVSCD